MATVRISRQLWAFSPQALLGTVFSVPPAAFKAMQRSNSSSSWGITAEGNASSSVAVELATPSSAEHTSDTEGTTSWVAESNSSDYFNPNIEVTGTTELRAALEDESNAFAWTAEKPAPERTEPSTDADLMAWGTWAEGSESRDSNVNVLGAVELTSGASSELTREEVAVAADGRVKSSTSVATGRSSNSTDTEKALASTAGNDANHENNSAETKARAITPAAASMDDGDGADVAAQLWSSDAAASQLYYTMRAMVDPAGVVAELRASLEHDGFKEHAHAAGLEDELSTARSTMGLFEGAEHQSEGASVGKSSRTSAIEEATGASATATNRTEPRGSAQKSLKAKSKSARLSALFGGDSDAGEAAAAAVAATEGPSPPPSLEGGPQARRRLGRGGIWLWSLIGSYSSTPINNSTGSSTSSSSSSSGLPNYGGPRGVPRGGPGAAASAVPLSVEGALIVLRLMGWVADVMSGTALCVAIIGGALVVLTLKDIFAEVHRYLLSLVARIVDVLKRRYVRSAL